MLRWRPNRLADLRWGIAFLIALTLALNVCAAPANCRIAGRISGASGKKTIRVALWQAEGFLGTPVRQVTIEPGAEPVYRFDVPAGRWAVSAFEDKNGNGTLDMGMFGPKEPSGFWRKFSGWHKPRFDEVAVSVGQDVLDADIVLR